MKNLISKLFLLSGLLFLLISSYLLYLRYASHPLTFERRPATVNSLSYETPRSIEIPSIKVNLPIVAALIHGKIWETTDRGISYLSSSPVPGQKGNSVMYGHNWKSILGNLSKVKPGQKLIVTMQNGKRKVFNIEYTATVKPDQTNIIDSTNDTRLTIYTCIGFLDSKRFVVVAKPSV